MEKPMITQAVSPKPIRLRRKLKQEVHNRSKSENKKPSSFTEHKLPRIANYYEKLRILDTTSDSGSFFGSKRKKTHFVGERALLDYIENYRKVDKIVETNRHHKVENNAITSYLSNLRDQRLSPKPMGLVKRRGVERVIDITKYAMGDSYAAAFAEGIKEYNFHRLILRDNRLSEKGALKILNSANYEYLLELDLSFNRVGIKSLEVIAELGSEQNSTLQILKLEGVHMKDRGASIVCKGFRRSTHLLELNLSKNDLQGNKKLCKFVKLSKSIQKLDLHWNNIRGEGARQLCKAVGSNNSLKVLDLSWNALSSPPEDNACRHLSKSLEKHPCLFHLDLSHNGLSVKDSETLSEGLKKNHTVMGLHMTGNHSSVDPLGFVETKTDERPSQAHIFTRIMNTGKAAEKGWRQGSNCWICERWSEVEFEFGGAEEPVHLHLSFEKYEADLMKKCEDSKFRLTRMCPPGRFRYFYTCNGEVRTDPSVPKVKLEEPLVEEIQLYEGVSVRINLKKTNFKDNVKGPDLLAVAAKPIPLPRDPHRKFVPKEAVKKWGIPISVFKDYKFDTEELLKKCFEFDWEHSKIPKLVKDDSERLKVKNFLWENYRVIKEAYKYYSSVSPQGEIWSVGQMAFTEFCYECKLFDSTFRLADVDFQLKASLFAEVKNPLNPANALVRYQFLEILARIAFDRAKKSGQGQSQLEAVCQLVNQHLKPNLTNPHGNKWRFERYINEEVDNVLKANLSVLKAVYSRYSVKKVKPGQKNFMSLEELSDICQQADLLTESFSTREIFLAFNLAMMSQVDELNQHKHLQMHFVEFLEAIARVSDMAKHSNPNTLEKPLAGAPLHLLLENTIPRLLKLLPSQFRK